MRIAMIGSRGVPARYGGVETAVQELSARLVERGHDVTVYCRAEDYDERPSTVRGIRCRYVRTSGGRTTGALLQAALASIDASSHRYDVVHYHAMGPTLFAALPRLTGRRVVATVQGRDDKRGKWGPVAQRLLGVAAWTSVHVPDATIAVSHELVGDLATSFGRPTTYIPNGISPVDRHSQSDADERAAVRRRGLEPGRYLLNVGRLVPEKRVDVLVRAFRDLPHDVDLAICGDHSFTDAFLRRLRDEAALDRRVHLLGPVYGEDLEALFRQAIGFVQASALEGLPLVLLEACAYGLPVVVSDIGPHLEVAGGHAGARVFPVDDVAGLTRQLAALLDADPSETQLAAKELSVDVLTRYDWDLVTDRTLAVYASVRG